MAEIEAIINDVAKRTEITQAVFAKFDKDGSGEIDKAELRVAITSFYQQASIEPPSDEQVDEALKALEIDKSGTVSVEQFKVLIKEVLKALRDGLIVDSQKLYREMEKNKFNDAQNGHSKYNLTPEMYNLLQQLLKRNEGQPNLDLQNEFSKNASTTRWLKTIIFLLVCLIVILCSHLVSRSNVQVIEIQQKIDTETLAKVVAPQVIEIVKKEIYSPKDVTNFEADFNTGAKINPEITKIVAAEVIEMVKNEIYSPKDLTNFAADFNGAMINTEMTTSYIHGIIGKLAGINTPDKILSANNAIGNCWGIAGQQGVATILLPVSIYVTGFSVYHVNTYEYQSAPKFIDFYGLKTGTQQQVLLSSVTFEFSDSPEGKRLKQYFTCDQN